MSKKKFPKKLLNVLGLLFWIYVPIKLFIYDIDILIIHKISPELTWIIEWRFLFITSIIVLLIAIYGFREFLRIISSILLFSLYFPSKRIFLLVKNNWDSFSKFIMNNFLLILVFVTNYISNLWRHFKFRFILFYLFILSVFLIFSTTNYYVNVISAYFLFAYLIIHYFYRTLTAIKPSPLLERILRFLGNNDEITNDDYLLKIESFEQAASLSFILVRGKEFVQRLKTIPYLILYFTLSLIYTAILSLIILGTLHWVLYKINPQYYDLTTASYYYFLTLGLNSLLTIETSFIKVTGFLPNLLITFGGILKWLLGLIYGVFLFNILKNHYNYTVSQVLYRIEKEETKVRNLLKEKYNKDMDSAINEFKEKLSSKGNKNKNI